VARVWELFRSRRGSGLEARFSTEDWALAKSFQFGNLNYPITGLPVNGKVEQLETSFEGYVQGAYKANGVIFATSLARSLLFSEARFQFQRMVGGRPTSLWGDKALELLETPWPGATTGDLLTRMEQDVTNAGNFYGKITGGRIRRRRPDWVQIILTAPPEEATDADIAGYLYAPGGRFDDFDSADFTLPEQMIHWAPIPDPIAMFRGMSWLTPVVREITADKAATDHKGRFFANAATPNIAIRYPESMSMEDFLEYVEIIKRDHTGSENAYKTMHVAGGADITVLGADLKQVDFKATQGAGETRIAAAGGVPPIIVGLSEGLSSATYSNYGMARRKFGDHWARPQWRSAAGALAKAVKVPAGSRLWYDDRDIPFLREDLKEEAEIMAIRASAIRTYLDAGFTPESAVAAVDGNELPVLEHSGMFSVQLQPPGTTAPDPEDPAGEDPAANEDDDPQAEA
jgi:phage portal protein BeeE